MSPGRFALYLKPLAQFIRQSQYIIPISVCGTSHHISLYADDVLIFMCNPSLSVPHLLKVFEEFGDLSGFRINCPKSAFLPLNETAKLAQLPAEISMVEHFTYLRVEIFPTLNRTVKHNYTHRYNKVLQDLNRWTHLPISLQICVSIIKMNILPRVNFISSVLPLPPPTGYRKKLNSNVTKFLWNNKRPRLKMSTIQQRRLDGGLLVPNFKLYFCCFCLRPLINWFNPKEVVSWHVLEEQLVSPWRLQDVIFTNISIKQCQLRFGPLISHVIQIWRYSQKSCGILCPWHLESPIFNNNQILTGQRPVTFSQWEKKGIHTLGDVYNDTGLRSFQDLKDYYDLPGSSFFFYLELRAALRAYGVPWGRPLEHHPFYKFITSRGTSRGFVSTFYTFLLKSSYKDLLLDKRWRGDVPELKRDFDWDSLV